MKNKYLSAWIILSVSMAWAQNTSREPIGGSTTNPVTQHDVSKSGEEKPLSEFIFEKKKPKTKVTPEKAEPAKPAVEDESAAKKTAPESEKKK